MKKLPLDFIDFKTKLLINCLSVFTIFFIILYGRLVCPFLEGLPFSDFFQMLLILYLLEIIFREAIFYYFGRVSPDKSPVRHAYKLSVSTWLVMGLISIALFEAVYSQNIPWHSNLKLMSAYWLLGAGIMSQIEYTIFERAFKLKKTKSEFKYFLDSLTKRISESMVVFTLVPSVTLLITILRYVYQDKIIPFPIAIEVFFIGFFLILASLVAGYIFSKQLTKDTANILKVINKFEKGQFPKIPSIRTDEIGRISFEMNQMISSLKEKEVIQKAFGYFVSSEIAKDFLNEYSDDENADLREKGRIKNLTILMSDIRDFTKFSENKEPDEVTSILNEYFSEMVDIIEKHGGIINKFIGDGLMAVFGLVNKNDLSSSTNAVNSSIAMRKSLKQLNERLGLSLRFGIGIHYGKVLSGYIGSRNRLEYTVIGATVNEASRIEQETKKEGMPNILYSQEVAQELSNDGLDSKFIKEVNVKGFEKEILLHSLEEKEEVLAK